MLNWIKWLTISLLILVLGAGSAAFFILNQSLPQLDGKLTVGQLDAPVSLHRDGLGQAVIKASTRADAAYALGLAHGQDRFFQMDLQRRAAAGELAQWLGERALNHDESVRFHQFRARARTTLASLPAEQRRLLQRYADGVNQAIAEFGSKPFEYWLTGFSPATWTPEDSLLVVYSMYLDLQEGQVKLDLARTGVALNFGPQMLRFLQSPSQYQSALDGSTLPVYDGPVPPLNVSETAQWQGEAPPDIGSNNWAVSGALTISGSAMLANDMHLGLRVPLTWYRAQLTYTRDGQPVQVTGVTLPGLPGIVVGTNGKIAWGFTNANLDNVDWVALPDEAPTWQVSETLLLPDGQHTMPLTMSEYGPVQTISEQKYALQWVAHQPYAANLGILDLDVVTTTEDAVALARQIKMPVQNMVIADADGNIAWTPAGAVTARPTPSPVAIAPDQTSAAWQQAETDLPVVYNPAESRIWTANARVISADQLDRFGDGGYALGARQTQIRDRLAERQQFDEQDFYAIQLDNEARFMRPWQQLLVRTLQTAEGEHAESLAALENWQGCACPESVGYTLTRRFRSQVINNLMAPIFSRLEQQGFYPNGLLRQIEPAVQRLLSEQPASWLPPNVDSWQALQLAAYEQARTQLLTAAGPQSSLADVNWGAANALTIKHPFADTVPFLGQYLNMPAVAGFGDSYMPAVQQPTFGASQRLFVQPGRLADAVLTLPGGQSGHPLSQYFQAGFAAFAEHQSTPLLPGNAQHTLTLTPAD